MRPATVLRLVTSAALILFLSFASMATAPNTSVTFVQASGGVWDSNPRGRVNALAVFKGADHCLLTSFLIPACLVSAGQRHDGVRSHPCASPCMPARLFSKCSTSRAGWTPTQSDRSARTWPLPAGATRACGRWVMRQTTTVPAVSHRLWPHRLPQQTCGSKSPAVLRVSPISPRPVLSGLQTRLQIRFPGLR